MSQQQRLFCLVPFMALILVSGLVIANFEIMLYYVGWLFELLAIIGLVACMQWAAGYDNDADDRWGKTLSFVASCFVLIGLGLLIFA